MYIPPFVAGVLATLLAEAIAIIIWGLFQNNNKTGGNDHE